MSRSRRSTPIFGYSTAESDKRFKTTEHRRERRAVRSLDLISADPPPPQAFGNPATSAKDGKHYWAGAKPKNLRTGYSFVDGQGAPFLDNYRPKR